MTTITKPRPRPRDTGPATTARIRKARQRRFDRVLAEVLAAGWTVDGVIRDDRGAEVYRP